MALSLSPALLVGVSLAVGAALSGAAAQTPATPIPPPQATAPGPEAPDPSLSPECRVPGSKLYTLAKLRAVKKALMEHRAVDVLAVGSSSGGLGAAGSYPVRLEDALEKSMPDIAVEVQSRGVSGEIVYGAAERLRNVVAETEPDLVVWQVGTNDALARVDIEEFSRSLADTVSWIKSHGIDVVLVDPQYTASLAGDDYFDQFVEAIRKVAASQQVPLVQRYEAMRYLAARAKGQASGGGFRLADLGFRCMAEHVTRAITVSLLEPDATATPPAGQSAARKPD
ncbi:GDSL-type esterase/lipase family protein [uncultured Methylobacterium sp.]|jgi:acyl-CoA thioesterase-1|uniref:SGNH/GDSL hydrolase family protein n=1 Tax=uncultured Methylobacterium sp. TaxID=157278 RepID=UPI00261CE3E9|nr:GDSL-type esterase/lipase family protein [uncultured Methylobacterium sp.]